MDVVHIPHRGAALVKAVVVVVLEDGGGLQPVLHEGAVRALQQPGHGGHVPDRTAPAGACPCLFLVADDQARQVIAQLVFAQQVAAQFRLADPEGRDHPHAGQLHNGGPAAKDYPVSRHILKSIELVVVRPVPGVAPQPHQHDLLRDGGLQQQGGGHVGDGPDGDDIQGIFRGVPHSPAGQVLGGGGGHGGLFIGQVAPRPLEHPVLQLLGVAEL